MRFFAVFSFLALLFPVWLFAPVEGGQWIVATTLATIVMIVSSLRLAILAQRRRPELLCMTFYMFIYVWCGLAAIAQTWLWRYSWAPMHTPKDAEVALILVLLTIVAYEFGRLIAKRRRVRLIDEETASAAQHRALLTSPSAVLGVCLFAWASVAFCAVWIGGVDKLFLSRGASSFHETTWANSQMERIVIWALLHAPPFVGLFQTSYICVKRWRELRLSEKRLYGGLLLSMLVLNLAANYPPAQLRLWLGAVVLAPMLALTRWRANAMAIWVFTLVLICVVIFPNFDIFKANLPVDEIVERFALSDQTVQQFVRKADFDVFQQTANGVVYVDLFDHMYGKNILGALLFWVPRSMWPEKPWGTGVVVPCALGYSFCNFASPLWMEFYVSFGFLGVVFLIGLYGFFSGRADDRYAAQDRSKTTINTIDFLVPFLAGFQFFILRGDLLNVVAYSSLTVLLILIATRPRNAPRSASRY